MFLFSPSTIPSRPASSHNTSFTFHLPYGLWTLSLHLPKNTHFYIEYPCASGHLTRTGPLSANSSRWRGSGGNGLSVIPLMFDVPEPLFNPLAPVALYTLLSFSCSFGFFPQPLFIALTCSSELLFSMTVSLLLSLYLSTPTSSLPPFSTKILVDSGNIMGNFQPSLSLTVLVPVSLASSSCSPFSLHSLAATPRRLLTEEKGLKHFKASHASSCVSRG